MFQVIDKHLEVAGLVGSVTLYYCDDEQVLVALDEQLKFKRYTLDIPSVTVLSAEKCKEILEYRLGVGCDCTQLPHVADVFLHGEYVTCVRTDVVGE